jgi:phosphoenolpyruvate carboxykinase (ATP)
MQNYVEENSTVISGLNALGLSPIIQLYYNLSFDELFAHETDSQLQGYERGIVSTSGAVAVDTGRFTGRSPKDKYIVMDQTTKDTVWWADGKSSGSDNKPINQETWDHLKSLSVKQLSGKKLYVMDGFCGANKDTRINVRLVTEVAWMAHFFKNMFIRPTPAQLKDFKPDWTILNACKTTCRDFAKYGLRSEVFVAFNITERMTVIGGTWWRRDEKGHIFHHELFSAFKRHRFFPLFREHESQEGHGLVFRPLRHRQNHFVHGPQTRLDRRR